MSETEGVALSQFINVAVAEKLSALRTEDYFRERGQRGDVAKAKRLLSEPAEESPQPPATKRTEPVRRATRCPFSGRPVRFRTRRHILGP